MLFWAQLSPLILLTLMYSAQIAFGQIKFSFNIFLRENSHKMVKSFIDFVTYFSITYDKHTCA